MPSTSVTRSDASSREIVSRSSVAFSVVAIFFSSVGTASLRT
jgi:hypothetical protein